MASAPRGQLGIGGMQHAVIVSYADRSAVLGAYGPYDTAEAAEAAIPKLTELPGMDTGALWEVRPLWQIPGLT